jgi:hypothetical protein
METQAAAATRVSTLQRRPGAPQAPQSSAAQAAPAAPAAPGDGFKASPKASGSVAVNYTPQDPSTMPAEQTTVPQGDIGGSLEGPRIKMDDNRASVKADGSGNYLFSPGTPEFQQAHSFACTTKSLRMFEGAVGHNIDWAFDGKLNVHPHAGPGFNAYYQRQDQSTNFFDGQDDKAGRTWFACESLDVVSHETGHAILDGMHPGLMGLFSSTEAQAFHESFGDVSAMLTALQDQAVVDKLAAQTNGDMHADNFVAHLAEELSKGINDTIFDGQKPEGWTIRNANNALHYEDPKHLPRNPPDETKLGKEAHNFSRLFTGAVWDIMAGLTSQNMAAGQNAKQAIAGARDTLLGIYARGVELGPDHMKKYAQMASAMREADQRYNGGANKALLEKVFNDRGIGFAAADDAVRVPSVTVAKAPAGLKEADALLASNAKALGVPADMKAQKVWTNKEGETFVRYGKSVEIELDPHSFTDGEEGLTLAFDKSGKLFHKLYEPVDAEQKQLVRDNVAEHFAHGNIRLSGTSLVRSNGKPFEGWFEPQADGRRKLVRNPVAID